MRLVKTLGFLIWASLATPWIVGWSIVSVSTWESSTRDIGELYEQRKRKCAASYSEPVARERCRVIMELERTQGYSIAMFNRGLLIMAPPLIGLGVAAYLARRRRPANLRKR
jgi:hypothetical protein